MFQLSFKRKSAYDFSVGPFPAYQSLVQGYASRDESQDGCSECWRTVCLFVESFNNRRTGFMLPCHSKRKSCHFQIVGKISKFKAPNSNKLARRRTQI